MISESRISLLVHERWRIALYGLLIHYCGVCEMCFIEHAENLIMSHINEVSPFNSDLSETIFRSACWFDSFYDGLFIVQVLNGWRIHVKFHCNRQWNESRMVKRGSKAFNL